MRSCSTRCPSARTCRACASASAPATGISWRAFSNIATIPRRRCRCPIRRWRSRRFDDETHVIENRKLYAAEIRSRRPDHRRPLRLQAPGRRLLPVARRLGAGRQRDGRGAAVARGGLCACCRANMLPTRQPTAPIRAATISASRWCMTTQPRPRRCIASSRCSGEGAHAAIDRVSAISTFLSDDLRARSRRRFGELFGLALLVLALIFDARACDLVGAGPELQSRHRRAGAQSARHARRDRRRSVDPAFRPGRRSCWCCRSRSGAGA